jgi:hypothetical protein
MAMATRLYDNFEAAGAAVRNLEAAGIPPDDISLIADNSDNWYRDDAGRVDDRPEGASAGAGVGAAVGGGTGLLAGLGVLTIPGIGPVVAAGWLAATAAGAVAGAATGGIIGSLFGADVSEANARIYANGIRQGGTLVSVRTNAVNVAELEGILDRSA